MSFQYLKDCRKWWISQGAINVPDIECSCEYICYCYGTDNKSFIQRGGFAPYDACRCGKPTECSVHNKASTLKACSEELVAVLKKHGMVLVTKSWEYPVLGYRRRKKRSGKDCDKFDERLRKALIESDKDEKSHA